MELCCAKFYTAENTLSQVTLNRKHILPSTYFRNLITFEPGVLLLMPASHQNCTCYVWWPHLIHYVAALQCRHNEHDGVSNRRRIDCLLDRFFIQAQIKENVKAPHHWPLWGEFIGYWRFPLTKASRAESVSIWWSHQVFLMSGIPHQFWMTALIPWPFPVHVVAGQKVARSKRAVRSWS